MLVALVIATLLPPVLPLQCWTYNRVDIKGVDVEEYDHGLLTCKPKEEVCFTSKKMIQQHARMDTIKIYRTGCGNERDCQRGSCCRYDECNDRLYTMMLTDVSVLPDFSETLEKSNAQVQLLSNLDFDEDEKEETVSEQSGLPIASEVEINASQ